MANARVRTLSFLASASMAALGLVGVYIAASAELANDNIMTVSYQQQAKRGTVYDSLGNRLAYDVKRQAIKLVPALFYSDEAVNSAIGRLLEVKKNGIEIKALPVDEKGRVTGSDDELELLRRTVGLEDAKPKELLERLYDVFRIDGKKENAYKTACIRYAAHISGDIYTLCEKPAKELSRQAEILAETEPFIRVDEYFERKYTASDGQGIAAHALQAVENELADRLKGTDGTSRQSYKVSGGSIELLSESGAQVQNGEDITLTIDSKAQLAVQKLLSQAIDDGRCNAGAICVVDCKNGDILALASEPSFRLDRYSEDYDKLCSDDSAPLFDRALWGLYRPGSAMKTITALAALDKKAIDGDTYLWCGRWYPLGDTTFSCLNYHGYESVREALRDSCNVFFYKCSQMLGIEQLSLYQSTMGLGSSVDIGISNAAGRIVTKDSIKELGIAWSEGLLLQSAIGQSENAVTPLQMAQWAQIIANGGELTPLSIIKGAESTPREILKNDTAFTEVKEGMILAADNIYGEYSLSALPEKAAIKTGTPEAGAGYNSTVIGFYPADNPEIAFSIVLENSESAYTLVKSVIEINN